MPHPLDRAKEEIRNFAKEPNVFGKVALLMIVGAAVGWLSVPAFDHWYSVVGDYRGTAAIALAACGASVVVLFTAIRNATLAWNGGDPMNIAIPQQFNSWLVLFVATGIGVTVALSIFR